MKQFTSVFVLFLFLSSMTYAQRSVLAAEIINKINNGEDVSYKGVKVTGNLLLTDIKDQTEDNNRDSWGKNGKQKAFTSHVRSKISFQNCTFEGKVIGYLNDEEKEELRNVNFYKEVSFTDCSFKQNVNFKYTEFPKKTSFEGSNFKEEAFFKYSHFSTAVSFVDVDFNGESTFKYTEFPGGVSFKSANFNGDANFKYTKFPKGVDFTNVVFKKDANFKYAKFYKSSKFQNTDFGQSANFKYTKMNGKDFSGHLRNQND